VLFLFEAGFVVFGLMAWLAAAAIVAGAFAVLRYGRDAGDGSLAGRLALRRMFAFFLVLGAGVFVLGLAFIGFEPN
jgi:hypothetical protein